jgi:WD40 repeat protein
VEARPIPGSELGPPVVAIFDPVFSPDGKALAFVSLSGTSNSGFNATIRRIEITGRAVGSLSVS